jgi:16S rRNA (guanine527-N7)-methyltransferase
MIAALKEAGIELNSKQMDALELFAHTLLRWNQRFNLTAIRSEDEIWVKHFLDSLSCLQVMSGTPMHRVVDVGSGAGFPGLILKIAHPEIQLTLIESVSKKVDFCEHLIQMFDLENVEVLNKRAELVGRLNDHREKYDWAVARAVAAMPTLVEYLLPFVKLGGRMLAQKGKNGLEETQSAENAIHLLGGKLDRVELVSLPGDDKHRTLIVIEKIFATPERYPRRVGIPTKRPLT